MADRVGYPTSDINSFQAVPTPSDGVFFTHIDDDGDGTEYISFFDASLGGFINEGFSDFGALPTGDSLIELDIWLYWSGATPISVTFKLLEGATIRGTQSLTPTTVNTPYALTVLAGDFTSVSSLRGNITRPTGGVGSLICTGMKITMSGPAFAHLDLVNGLLQVVPAGTLGEISLINGLPVRSSHGERYGESLILENGLWKVQPA